MRHEYSVLLLLLLASCVSDRDRTKEPTQEPRVQAQAEISEVQMDNEVAPVLGIYMRKLAIRYPSSLKLSVVQRLYRDGVLELGMSSRQVHGTTMAVGTEYLSLGLLDPDGINPQPQGQIKLFGSLGPWWFKKPPGANAGGVINVLKTGALAVGSEQLVMELRYGIPSPHPSVQGFADYPENVSLRVTLQVLVEPLDDKEKEELKAHSNFNKAFKVSD